MTVKIEDIREGDEVLVRFTYVGRADETIRLGFDANSIVVRVLADRIAQHIPRKIEVGDDVVVNSGGLSGARGTIRAIYGQFAWVFSNSVGGYCTVPLSDLERVS